MDNSEATALSLFSGVGGLDLGWELATGGRVVGYCERDAYAASVLLGRMEDEAMEPAPVWAGDIQELDVAPFHGVGWVIGGFPCQDISVAGKGEGIEGERSGLWGELLRAYRDSGARYLFAENVSVLTLRGLDRVLHDLAEIGADAEWLCLRASSVGAPHRRERCFILADTGCSALRHEPGRRRGQDRPGPTGPRDAGEAVADSNREGRGRLQEPGLWRAGVHDADRCGKVMADTTCRDGLRQASGASGYAAQCEQGLGQSRGAGLEVGAPFAGNGGEEFAPVIRAGDFPGGPGSDWGSILPHLHPAIEPGLHVLADGASVVVDASRADQLRCCGNGVVPLQAATALVELLRRIQE